MNSTVAWDWWTGEVNFPNRYPENSRRLWKELWKGELDVRREIIEPALARRREGYGEPPPPYKSSLSS